MKEKIFFMVYKNLVSDCWLFRERFHVLDAAKLLEICEIAKIVRGISDFRLYKFFSPRKKNCSLQGGNAGCNAMYRTLLACGSTAMEFQFIR